MLPMRMAPWTAGLVLGVALATTGVHAQDLMDEEARALFQAGSTAFQDGRYEDALGHFRRAHELSRRPQLLYNIGLAADRLRRDAEALEAFEEYLRLVPDTDRQRDVEARVRVLRETAQRQAPPHDVTETGDATETSDATATGDVTTTGDTAATAVAPDADDASEGRSALSIVGPVVLGVAGLAGVTAAVVGLASENDCLSMDGDRCSESRSANGLGLGVYGGLGVAAIAGAILWLVLGGGDGAESADAVALRPAPSGLDLRVRF